MEPVLVLFLSHQLPQPLRETLERWRPVLGKDASLLLAYGGDAAVFPRIDHEPKVFIADPLLRVRDQQRNRQSWREVFLAARDFLAVNERFAYVYLVEYDQVPLVPDLLARLVARLHQEDADVLAHHLHRVDGTSNAHYLYHAHERRFHDFFAAISKRKDKRTILSMLGSGSFWKREAFELVASMEKPFPIYVELYLPTLAHHLGLRLRDLREQNPFVMPLGDRINEIDEARSRGGWTLHPVKSTPLDRGKDPS